MDSGFEIKYRKLFRTYYANLLFYAKRIVGDDDAEDVVQDVFVELWHRKKTKITDEQRRCVKMHPFFLLRTKKVCQNAHLHYFTYKAPTFTSWGFVIT